METTPATEKARSTPLVMSANATSTKETARPDLDRVLEALKGKAREFARLSVDEKRKLLAECRALLPTVASDWVAGGCKAKGLIVTNPNAGEEWLGGPVTTIRNVRLLEESLASIIASGKPAFGKSARTRTDGKVEIDVFPASGHDKALFTGFSGKIVLEKGLTEKDARERQASFYSKKDPEGGVSLILGAGNVSSIPPMDALYKMFVDGLVCIVKMNPVNEWVGPILERAFKPLIARGYLAIAYGGGDVGAYLSSHALIDDIHITGSDRTHDLIVWGPPGPDRDRRLAANDPILKKPITSELGNVSPVVVVPAEYSESELWFQARNVCSMVVNNGSFNCNAAKVLIVSAAWKQREQFRKLVAKALGEVPPRKAYYPGAADRYKTLTEGRDALKIGTPSDGELAWAFLQGVDSADEKDPLWRTEPFCGILTETALPESDPVEFLAKATLFCNDRLWGTLNACIIIHPKHEHDPTVGAALDRSIDDLRYGTVAVNHWPALGYGFVTPPWGGHPSATLANIQSGLGWVHNTYMIEGIEKGVIRGPLKVSPKPAWFYDNSATAKLGNKLVKFEASPSWWKIPGMAITAMGG